MKKLLLEGPLQIHPRRHGSRTQGDDARTFRAELGNLGRIQHGRTKERDDYIVLFSLTKNLEEFSRRHPDDAQRVRLDRAGGSGRLAGGLQGGQAARQLQLGRRQPERSHVAGDDDNSRTALRQFYRLARHDFAQPLMRPRVDGGRRGEQYEIQPRRHRDDDCACRPVDCLAVLHELNTVSQVALYANELFDV